MIEKDICDECNTNDKFSITIYHIVSTIFRSPEGERVLISQKCSKASEDRKIRPLEIVSGVKNQAKLRKK